MPNARELSQRFALIILNVYHGIITSLSVHKYRLLPRSTQGVLLERQQPATRNFRVAFALNAMRIFLGRKLPQLRCEHDWFLHSLPKTPIFFFSCLANCFLNQSSL